MQEGLSRMKFATAAAAALLGQAVLIFGLDAAVSAELPTMKPKRAESANADDRDQCACQV